ncbi:hypothetical protein TMatcc_009844 [Talaromyces marneffei ATCC 18224]|uniref:uncharacterized protein n=1 Tax=Talaromyces marneffei TaxID=37727 RepID=UPI0012AAB706|nr:uncharacterized protein EYB26_009073 [Talaromyces marneffei]KAE8548010.1 hypothetical protein EYB25_009803 [Talaromyces marneffei]QGA21363.1 hypothetical protein EYB26_009073 [Talaromyces marneffei]
MDTDNNPPPPYTDGRPFNTDPRPPKYALPVYPDTSHTSITTPPTFHALELDHRETIFPSGPSPISPAFAKGVLRWCCVVITGFLLAAFCVNLWIGLAIQRWRF